MNGPDAASYFGSNGVSTRVRCGLRPSDAAWRLLVARASASRIDRDCLLGTGARLPLRAEHLGLGEHVITVTARDSAGQASRSTVPIRVVFTYPFGGFKAPVVTPEPTSVKAGSTLPRPLHARGGAPYNVVTGAQESTSSPPTWRWFVSILVFVADGAVVSTHVAVLRRTTPIWWPHSDPFQSNGSAPHAGREAQRVR
ncbi:hypothetical protein GCM10010166_62640 [Couchioplanes caeruleus subsp. azureus]|nr:hypothetical protein GCM10010166_62640 [Couchioplanes caeruleus subsp. azureus]